MSVTIASILLPALASEGVPILKGILRRRGGKAGEIAGEVMETVATHLGVESSPEGLAEAIRANKDQVIEIVKEIEHVNGEMYLQMLADDAKSDSTLQRLWRPVTAVLFGVCCFMVIVTACWMLLRQIPINAELLPVIGLVVPTLTLMAGVTGYYVDRRSREKIAGAA